MGDLPKINGKIGKKFPNRGEGGGGAPPWGKIPTFSLFFLGGASLKHVRWWPESGVWPDRREKIRINQTRLHLRGSVHGCNMDAVFMIRNNWIIKAGTFLRWNDKSRQLDTLGLQLGSQLASNQFERSLE